MKIEDFTDHHLRSIHDLLDEAEEKDPKIAEHLARTLMFKISERWQKIYKSNQKRESLTDIENLN